MLAAGGDGCQRKTNADFAATRFSQETENIGQVVFDEPSGIVFHAQRGTLFVVGDEGDIGEFQTDGRLVQQARHLDADDETLRP